MIIVSPLTYTSPTMGEEKRKKDSPTRGKRKRNNASRTDGREKKEEGLSYEGVREYW